MRRREFLQFTGLSLGALSAAPLAARAQEGDLIVREPLEPFRPDDWASVRDQFPLTRSYIHMATFLLASHPRPVAEAIERYRKGFDENPVEFLHNRRRLTPDPVHIAAADYMGGQAANIALTDSTTMGLGILYNGLQLEPGDEIVSTTHDHYSTQMSLRHRADRTGATVRELALYDDPARASVDEIVARMKKAITDRTRVLAVTWVHSCTGVKLPLAAMAAALGEINAKRDAKDRVLFCVDGVHGFGIEEESIPDLGCDFFCAGTHKWIFGPRGTGVIWGRPEAWKRARPIIPSFGENYGVWLGRTKLEEVSPGDLMSPGGFHSFEHRWAVEDAFRFHLQIGKSRVRQRIHELNSMTKQAMAEMKHVKMHTPMTAELSAGIICFEVAGHDPEKVVEHFRGRGIIASTSPYRVSYARLAPSLLTNEEEIGRTLEALKALA